MKRLGNCFLLRTTSSVSYPSPLPNEMVVTEGGPRVTAADETGAARIALRELVEAYAIAVDAKNPEQVASLFAAEGRLVSTFGPGSPESPLVRSGRRQITAALSEGLAVYLCTTHIVGAHMAEVAGSTATGLTTCLAHHVYEHDSKRRLMVMAVRYEDSYVVEDGNWRFEERKLWVDWRTDSPLGGE